jgi:Tfp pilus assembly protein PilN
MIRINLAPPPEGRPRRAEAGGPSFRLPEMNFLLLFGVIYLVAAVFLGGWWWKLQDEEVSLQAQVTQANADLAALKTRIGQAGKVKEHFAELTKRVEAIQELTKGQTRTIVLLDALADIVPKELWLTGMEERGTTLRLSGTSFTTTAVSDFMTNLRSSGRFKDVDIVISRQEFAKTPNLVTFEVTCRFES